MTTSAPAIEDAQHWAHALYELKIAMLGELAEGGMELARAVKHQALDPEVSVEPNLLEGLIRAYGRAARTVRLTLMLQDRLIKTVLDFDKADAQEAVRNNPGPIDIVHIIVDPEVEREKRERLAREGAEGLDRETFEEAMLDRSIDEFIAKIRQDGALAHSEPLPGEAGTKEQTARSPFTILRSPGRPSPGRGVAQPPRSHPDG